MSRIRSLFQHLQPSWVDSSLTEENWSPCLQTLEGHTDLITVVVFSSDGRRLASGGSSKDRTLRVWNAETGILQQTLRCKGQVNSAAFSQDGRWLASGSCDEVQLWNSESDMPQQTFIVPRLEFWMIPDVHCVTFLFDGHRLASFSCGGVWIWDVDRRELLQKFVISPDIFLKGRISHDGGKLALTSNYKKIQIWDTETGGLHEELPISSYETLALSPDGRNLAAAMPNEEIQIWDIGSKKIIQTLPTGEKQIGSVVFSHDGRYMASGGHDKVQIWDLETNLLRETFRGHTDSIRSLAFSQDSQRLASGSHDETVRIWNMEMGEVLQPSEYPGRWANKIALSHDGRFLVSDSASQKLMLWNVKTNALHKPLEGHTQPIVLATFSRDGRWLAAMSRLKTWIWNVVTGELRHTLEPGYVVDSLAFSYDGRWLAVAMCEGVLIWDIETGESQQTIYPLLNDQPSFVKSVAISVDGKLIALGSRNGIVRIWDVRKGAMLKTSFKGHTGRVNLISFSSNGRWLATGSVDNTVKIWDLDSGTLQQTLAIGELLTELSYGPQDSCLITNIGSIVLDMSSSDTSRELTWSGCGLKSNAAWITWDGRNLLWLPWEYRSSTVAVRGSMVAISRGWISDKLFFINFSSNDFPML